MLLRVLVQGKLERARFVSLVGVFAGRVMIIESSTLNEYSDEYTMRLCMLSRAGYN